MSQQFWYNFIFVWLAIMALVALDKRRVHLERADGGESIRWKLGFAILAFWPIYYAVVFTQVRYDMYLYLSVYDSLPHTFAGLIDSFDLRESGNLFSEIEILIRCIFGTDRIWFRIIIGLLHSIPVVLIFRKYSVSYLFSIFLFAATGCQQAWMMNGMRQFLAVVIIFAATPWMLEKKYVKAILAVFIASRIHTSALMMLPLVFVCNGKAWNRKTVLFLIGSVAAMVVFANVTGSFDSLLEGTEYAGVEAAWDANGDDGMHVLRALVAAVPVVMAYLGRKRIKEEDNSVVNLCVNMSVANLGISLIAVVTSGIMVGRLPIYTNLYNFILLPYLIRHLFSSKNAAVVSVLTVILYMMYYRFG